MSYLRLLTIASVCAAAVLQGADAYSSGACPGSCSTLVPQHEGATGVSGASGPYALQAPQKVAPSSKATVTIGGAPFKGFIIRAMDANGKEGGSFFAGGHRYKAISCDATNDTATHTDSSDKTSISLEWVTPSVPGVYRLVSTIVKEYSTFYTGYYTDVVVQ